MSCDYFKTSLCNCKAYECVVKYDIVILQNHTMFNPFTTTHQGPICFANYSLVHHQTRRKQNNPVNRFVAESPCQEAERYANADWFLQVSAIKQKSTHFRECFFLVHHQTRRKQNDPVNRFVAESPCQEAERYANADWYLKVCAIKQNYTLFISFTSSHQGQICFADSLLAHPSPLGFGTGRRTILLKNMPPAYFS